MLANGLCADLLPARKQAASQQSKMALAPGGREQEVFNK